MTSKRLKRLIIAHKNMDKAYEEALDQKLELTSELGDLVVEGKEDYTDEEGDRLAALTDALDKLDAFMGEMQEGMSRVMDQAIGKRRIP